MEQPEETARNCSKSQQLRLVVPVLNLTDLSTITKSNYYHMGFYGSKTSPGKKKLFLPSFIESDTDQRTFQSY